MVEYIDAIIPSNPFNPGSPVDPKDFIGRMQEIENFKHKLRQTDEGSLASMSVAGGYGIGKTSFLHKCKLMAEENNSLTIYFSLSEMKTLDRDYLCKILIERLKEKVREDAILKRISFSIFESLKKIKLKTPVDFELSYNASQNEFPNLHSALSAVWKEVSKEKKSIVFLIDEAGILEKNKADLIMHLRAVLEHLQINRTPVMIVLSGKFAITASSGSGFSPLVRTFPPSILENFSEEESNIFIRKKLTSRGINISDELLKIVYEKTEGHPFVLSAYMASCFQKLISGEKELNKNHFQATDINFVQRILAPFFSRFYDNAGKNSREVLYCISKNGGEMGLSELSEELKKENSAISPYLAKLVQDGAILRLERGKYKLFHQLFKVYILKHSNFS